MSKNNNIIEINGQRYDASTGKPLGKLGLAGQHIDGIRKAPAKKAVQHTSTHKTAPSAKRHHPETAKTLMRSGLKKPVVAPKSSIKAKSHASVLARKPQATVTPKSSANNVDDRRLQHAHKVSKSTQIRRFNRVEPSHPGQFLQAPTASITPSQPTPAHQPPHEAKTVSALFDQALAKADAHKQPAHKKPRRSRTSRRAIGITGVSVAAVLLLGIVTYQNLDNFNLMRASAKAGFSAELPGYQPSGYSVSSVNSANGHVTIRFQSNSDDRTYLINQEPSNWDSSTLRDSFVSTFGPDYQTVQAGGRTIYLYGAGNATWVSHGIRYTVSGNNSLSDRQLVDLAASL